ncbi:hypothetical protein HMF3257_30775 [Spirosoma telluris]|uniref:RHS repeat-associated core domain-containing protein n=1 Tax=Spirosoma telluris TaxID=2183553 RepID=A0A327NX50_9BACT|nr:hypothetical protein HMF3257_30775 [Spirosoma telluris]
MTLTATGCPTNVRWSTGQTGSPLVLTPSATTSYWAYCIDDEVVGNSASTAVQVTVANSLTVNGRTDYTVGETISLTAVSSVQGATYTWYGPSGFSQTGQVLQRLGAAVSQSGNYTVVATSGQGCAGKKTVPISVTVSSFTCTCTDCDLIAVKETTNPANKIGDARNQGSKGQNFVTESVYLEKNGTSVAQTISYFDGLGRPSQKVSVGTAGGSSAGDVIAPIVYDAFGREPQKYLPYVDGATPGTFRLAGAGAVQSYYNGLPGKTGTAFSTMTYEASPLNRVLTQTAPGSNTPVKISYRTNTAGEVKRLDVGTTTVTVATYDANQLYVTQTTDENQNSTIEYKDKEGRVVCKDVSGHKTLYGYDDLGQLRLVVPPLASSVLSGSFNLFDAGDELSFAYEYDARGRMTRKKVPGAGISTMSYTSHDLLERITDANGVTVVTTYDSLDRVISTSLTSGQVLTQTFYDGSNYSPSSPVKYTDVSDLVADPYLPKPKGMVTGTIVAQLNGGADLQSAIYYDDLGRAVQTVSQNHKDRLDISTSKLDFVGRVLESRLTTTNSSTTITVDSRTAYEQGGRVKSVCQRVSDNQQTPLSNATLAYWEPVARHTYNGIGELTTKTLGCGFQTIDYQYQMRGWLSQMNDPANLNQGTLPSQKDFFGMKLAYDGVGNITNWDYSNAQTTYSPYGLSQKPAYQYGFTYDNLNRLTSGALNQQGQTKFTLNGLTYDDNGNITHLNRAMGTATDNLSYSYKNGGNSNQLASVSDGGSADFAKSSTYNYDAVGNLIKDTGKGINLTDNSPITYNHLNLPKTVIHSGGTVNYTYSASGQKLKADFGGGKTYDYVGGLVYDKDGLEFIPTAEGRVLPPGRASTTVAIGGSTSIVASNSFYRYEYHLKDHLGNLRAACRCGERQTETTPGDGYEPLVVQEQHYDPFGLDLTGLSSQPGVTGSRFKYNGKEEQQGLGWIDYGSRMYDSAVPRWLQVDPHAEKYESISPFSYGFDNPIRFVDLQGKDPGDVVVLFAGANLNPSSNPYGITNRLLRRLNDSYFREHEGSVDKFISNYAVPTSSKDGNPYLDFNPTSLTQEAYEYVKNHLQADGRLVVFGYSWGGVLANYLTKRLKEDGIKVDKLIIVDAANGLFSKPLEISENNKDVDNFYQTNRSIIGSRGYPAEKQSKSTQLKNNRVDFVKDGSGKLVKASHTNIDDANLNKFVKLIIDAINGSRK